MTFLQAMLTHLKLSSESLAGFRAQLAHLTPRDREELKAAFIAEGIAIDE